MQFADIIGHLSTHLRLPDLAPDASGACAVKLDGLVYSFCSYDEGQSFLVRSRLGQLDDQDESSLAELLEGNLFDDGIGGGALGVDAEGDVFLSQYFEASPAGFPRFLEHFELFVGTSEHWARRLPAVVA